MLTHTLTAQLALGVFVFALSGGLSNWWLLIVALGIAGTPKALDLGAAVGIGGTIAAVPLDLNAPTALRTRRGTP